MNADLSERKEKWGTIADDCNGDAMPITAHVRAIDAVYENFVK